MGDLRAGNKALDYLLRHLGPGEALTRNKGGLSGLADSLYSDAREAADALLKGDDRVTPQVSCALADCVFDLQLVSCFSELLAYYRDAALASVFVDAVLYQATGAEPGTATEPEILDEGTHRVRGISKYALAKKLITIPDAVAWLLGKEYSALKNGTAKDLAYIVAAAPYTILIREHARWRLRYFLQGVLPSDGGTGGIRLLGRTYQDANV